MKEILKIILSASLSYIVVFDVMTLIKAWREIVDDNELDDKLLIAPQLLAWGFIFYVLITKLQII